MFTKNKLERLRRLLDKEYNDIKEERMKLCRIIDSEPDNKVAKSRECFLGGIEVGLLKARRTINKVYGEE